MEATIMSTMVRNVPSLAHWLRIVLGAGVRCTIVEHARRADKQTLFSQPSSGTSTMSGWLDYDHGFHN